MVRPGDPLYGPLHFTWEGNPIPFKNFLCRTAQTLFDLQKYPHSPEAQAALLAGRRPPPSHLRQDWWRVRDEIERQCALRQYLANQGQLDRVLSLTRNQDIVVHGQPKLGDVWSFIRSRRDDVRGALLYDLVPP